MFNLFLKNSAIVFSILICAFLYLRYFERHSLFFPSKEILTSPDFLGLKFREVNFQSSKNIILYAWFIPCENSKTTILYCHGNAGNISNRIAKAKIFHDLGFNVFVFDYRGYGKSSGQPTEKGLYQDTLAAYNYLKNEIKAERIVGFGESLGSAVIIDLATKIKLDGLVTEGGFSSVEAMGKRIYPFIPTFLYSLDFDSINKIKKVSCPKLFIHSVNDEIVPFSQGQDLFNAAEEPKQFLKIFGSHNDAFLVSQKIFAEAIKQFLK